MTLIRTPHRALGLLAASLAALLTAPAAHAHAQAPAYPAKPVTLIVC